MTMRRDVPRAGEESYHSRHRRHDSYKKGVNFDTNRRLRVDYRVHIRKAKREEGFSKRRALSSSFSSSSSSSAMGGVAMGVVTASWPQRQRQHQYQKQQQQQQQHQQHQQQRRQFQQQRQQSQFQYSFPAPMNSSSSSLPPLPPSVPPVPSVSDVPFLIQSLSDPESTPHVVLEAVRGFRRLLSHPTDPPADLVVKFGAVPLLVSCLSYSYSSWPLVPTTRAVKEAEATDEGPIIATGEGGEEATAVAELDDEEDDGDAIIDEIHFEAAWALTNIASTDKARYIVTESSSTAVTSLVRLLSTSSDANVREQCGWCLGNLAGDGADIRDIILECGGVDALLLNVIRPATPSLLSNAIWSLSNLCRGRPHPPLHYVRPAIPRLANLLSHPDITVASDAAWALSYLSDGGEDRICDVMETGAGVAGRMVGLLSRSVALIGIGGGVSTKTTSSTTTTIGSSMSPSSSSSSSSECCVSGHGAADPSSSSSLITPALRALGNFVSGSDSQTQEVLDAGILDVMLPLLTDARRTVRREACWLLSNVAAGTHSQISSLLARRDVASALVRIASEDEWGVRLEALWAVSNAITGGAERHIASLVRLGAIRPLCDALTSSWGGGMAEDVRAVSLALDALDAVLISGMNTSRRYDVLVEECGGIEAMLDLQTHADDGVYERAVEILESHFGGEEEEEDMDQENLDPVENEKSLAFGLTGIKKDADMIDDGEDEEEGDDIPRRILFDMPIQF